MKYLITGANGFVGKVLCAELLQRRSAVRAAVRGVCSSIDHVEMVVVGSIDGTTDWTVALEDIDAVIHLAARVHVMNDKTADPLEEFRRVNATGTLNLARQAAAAGVRRFVFLSSVKVNGEKTQIGCPFTARDTPNPADPYGISKYEAEEGLRQIAEQTGMGVVIIRPVLVYGAGVKGNFLSMMRWLNKGVPLPLGAINNKRSLVSLDNLVDLIVTCMHHPAAANQTFLVSDGEDLSTTELLKRTAFAMGCKARLISVPSFIMQAGVRLLGNGDVAQRLCGSLQVDISKTRSLLGWSPPLTVGQGLVKAAENFLRNEND